MSTSTFGVGEDFDEALLQGMADAGGGHFYFIERPEQITDLIASEVGELLEIVARDAAIELTAPEGLTVRSMSPFPLETGCAKRRCPLRAGARPGFTDSHQPLGRSSSGRSAGKQFA